MSEGQGQGSSSVVEKCREATGPWRERRRARTAQQNACEKNSTGQGGDDSAVGHAMTHWSLESQHQHQQDAIADDLEGFRRSKSVDNVELTM